ncbi:hypothetical protein AAC609_11240, partial [Neisseria gonorrhoeae]
MKGDRDFIFRVQSYAQEQIKAQVEVSSGRMQSHSVGYVVWGTIVTGSKEPVRDLFNEALWCPGFDRHAISGQLTELLAGAAAEYDGDSFIHPECLAGDEAHDFVRLMVNEQTIDDIITGVVKPRVG